MIASFDQAYLDTNLPENPGPNNQIPRAVILPCWTNAAIRALVKLCDQRHVSLIT